MSKSITVILMKDKTYEVHELNTGFMVAINDEVEAVYNATSKLDAELAVENHINAGTKMVSEE